MQYNQGMEQFEVDGIVYTPPKPSMNTGTRNGDCSYRPLFGLDLSHKVDTYHVDPVDFDYAATLSSPA